MSRGTKALCVVAAATFFTSIGLGISLFRWQGVSYEFVSPSGNLPSVYLPLAR